MRWIHYYPHRWSYATLAQTCLVIRSWVFPEGQIDHINGVRDDNRLSNLRAVSKTENMWNQRKAHPANKLGVMGVRREYNMFQARISINGKTIWLGSFNTAELAHEAYLKAKRELHTTCTI